MIKKLNHILELTHSNKNNLVNLFPDLQLDEKLIDTIVYVNMTIANKQFQNLNEIIDFIKGQNFYGDIFQSKKAIQIEASKYWIDTFLSKDKQTEIRNNTTKYISNYKKLIHTSSYQIHSRTTSKSSV